MDGCQRAVYHGLFNLASQRKRQRPFVSLSSPIPTPPKADSRKRGGPRRSQCEGLPSSAAAYAFEPRPHTVRRAKSVRTRHLTAAPIAHASSKSCNEIDALQVRTRSDNTRSRDRCARHRHRRAELYRDGRRRGRRPGHWRPVHRSALCWPSSNQTVGD